MSAAIAWIGHTIGHVLTVATDHPAILAAAAGIVAAGALTLAAYVATRRNT